MRFQRNYMADYETVKKVIRDMEIKEAHIPSSQLSIECVRFIKLYTYIYINGIVCLQHDIYKLTTLGNI